MADLTRLSASFDQTKWLNYRDHLTSVIDQDFLVNNPLNIIRLIQVNLYSLVNSTRDQLSSTNHKFVYIYGIVGDVPRDVSLSPPMGIRVRFL